MAKAMKFVNTVSQAEVFELLAVVCIKSQDGRESLVGAFRALGLETLV